MRAAKQWNKLPKEPTELSALEIFSTQLNTVLASMLLLTLVCVGWWD